ncbi:hypothetical protein [Novosphingobium sp. UBA1939]|nr:hypothetical protein [Novosphingobium sp. UBA1939]
MTSADLLAAYIRTYALDGNRFRQFQEAAAIPETPQNSKVDTSKNRLILA